MCMKHVLIVKYRTIVTDDLSIHDLQLNIWPQRSGTRRLSLEERPSLSQCAL